MDRLVDNEMENSRANSPVNGTLRQQLEDMFKHRTSRYNFLDLSKSRWISTENLQTKLFR